jgi:hypothetical protein
MCPDSYPRVSLNDLRTPGESAASDIHLIMITLTVSVDYRASDEWADTRLIGGR